MAIQLKMRNDTNIILPGLSPEITVQILEYILCWVLLHFHLQVNLFQNWFCCIGIYESYQNPHPFLIEKRLYGLQQEIAKHKSPQNVPEYMFPMAEGIYSVNMSSQPRQTGRV